MRIFFLASGHQTIKEMAAHEAVIGDAVEGGLLGAVIIVKLAHRQANIPAAAHVDAYA